LSNPHYKSSHLYTISGGHLPLSGEALLELMQAVISKGVPFRFCARGWSMAPFINDLDTITVSPLGSKKTGVGEVFAYVHPFNGKLIVHRAVAKADAGLLFRGDGVPDVFDGVVPFENLLGRVTRIERKGRQVWLGLGPERYLIAVISRLGLLIPLRRWLKPFFHFFRGRIDQ
jgi:hypothetical protein